MDDGKHHNCSPWETMWRLLACLIIYLLRAMTAEVLFCNSTSALCLHTVSWSGIYDQLARVYDGEGGQALSALKKLVWLKKQPGGLEQLRHILLRSDVDVRELVDELPTPTGGTPSPPPLLFFQARRTARERLKMWRRYGSSTSYCHQPGVSKGPPALAFRKRYILDWQCLASCNLRFKSHEAQLTTPS